jgi:hypothetical protein
MFELSVGGVVSTSNLNEEENINLKRLVVQS